MYYYTPTPNNSYSIRRKFGRDWLHLLTVFSVDAAVRAVAMYESGELLDELDGLR